MSRRVSMSSERVSIVFWSLVYLKEVISIDSSRIQAVKVGKFRSQLILYYSEWVSVQKF